MKQRIRQTAGYVIGLTMGLGCLAVLTLKIGEHYLIPGPRNVGHEDLRCEFCHKPAAGTVRQQIQANIQYLLGQRPQMADFGRRDVNNQVCVACHSRPNDRHPIYRFLEPRFKKARQRIQPQYCISCHLEHRGKRVTKTKITFCKTCHDETSLKKDPISISHKTLIAEKRWESCLGCHDFHGNHVMTTETDVDRVLQPERILDYFQGGASPYSEKKHYLARETPRDEQ